MPTPSNHSFTSAFPFEIKIENQFMNEGHSTLYIVNKVDAAASEQQLKLLINVAAPGPYTFKAIDKIKTPGPNNCHMALAFRPGVLLEAVAQSFHQVLSSGIDEALGKDNTCIVHGPVLRSDKAQIWYVAFQKDVIAKGATPPKIDWVPESEETQGLQLKRYTIGPDGRRYGIDIDHKLYTKSSNKGNWEPSTWSWQIESIALLSNGSVFYASLDDTLIWGGSEAGEQSFWIPVQPPTVVRSIALLSEGQLIGINQHGHLIRVDLILNPTANLATAITNITSILDTSQSLISVCALPDGRILGVDTQNDLHEWNVSTKQWTPIFTPTKLIQVTADAGGIIYAIGTDHQLYRQVLTYSPENILNISLNGVSAAAGTGARSSQIECQFGKVQMNGNPHDFSFKANTQLNIVNHQGAGFAPLHFGVMGSDVMVKGEKNTLKPYFLTKERVPIKLGKDTTFTFNFPYANGNKLPGIGKSDQVEGISPNAVEGRFTPEPIAHDTIHHTWNFPFKANGNKIDTELFEGIFEFSNIQLAEYRGPVIVEVTVKNLPGYWDSAFQIPVVIGDSSLTDALNLVETSTGGNSKALGAKINFLSSGTDEGNFPNVAIEEHWGLELFGTLPDSESQKAGQEIRVRRANLIIPEGKVAIGTKDNISSKQGNTHVFPTESGAHLYVQGDSKLIGGLNVTGMAKLEGPETTIEGTTNLKGSETNIEGTTNLKGSETNIEGTTNLKGSETNIEGTTNLNGTQTNITGTTNLNGPVTTSNGKPLDIKGNIKISGTTIVNGPITTENKDQVITFSHHTFTKGWMGSQGTTYVRGQLAVGKNDKPHERFHVDESGNVTIGQGMLTAEKAATFNGLMTINKGFTSPKNEFYKKDGWTVFQKNTRSAPSLKAGGTTIGFNRVRGQGMTSFYNLIDIKTLPGDIPAFEFHQITDPGVSKELMVITRNGRVGIGITYPIAPLHVNGTGPNADKGGMYFDEYRSVEGYNVEGKQQVSILAQESVLARRFVANSYAANSDVRIKTGINASDEQQDLLKLLQVKIRNYSYIDYVKNSTKTVKGVIAQELEKTFPEAVTQMSEFIPDIYQACDELTWDEGLKELTCELKEPHGLKVGDKVKLITESDQEFFNEVVAVNDAQSFTVKDWEEKVDRIFVYGKEVDDFRTVDYTQVSMMGISAIQAMHKEMEVLKEENKELKQGYESIKEENAALKDQLLNEMQSLRAEMEAMKAAEV